MNTKKYNQTILTVDQILSPSSFLEVSTVEKIKEATTDLLNNSSAWIETINKVFSIADLKARVYCNGTKKADFVKSFYRALLSSVAQTGTISYEYVFRSDRDQWRDAAELLINKRSNEEWEKIISDKKVSIAAGNAILNARLKEAEKPSTAAGYIDMLNMRGFKNMSDSEISELDRLVTLRDKDIRDKRLSNDLNRLSIELDEIVFEVIDTVHTQKNYDLFVVKFSEWVPRTLWLKAYERAKEFGGWYSGYDVGDAVTGLQFKSKEARALFCESVLTGGEQLESYIDEARKLQAMTSSDRFNAMAERLENKALPRLKYQGLTNTCRRAGIAARSEEKARYDIAMAGTMKNLSEHLIANPESILSGIKYRTQLETLLSILKTAELVRDIKYPNLALKVDRITDLYNAGNRVDATMACSMLNKRLKEAAKKLRIAVKKKSETRTFEELRNLYHIHVPIKTYELLGNKGTFSGLMYYLGEKYTQMSRLQKMGIVKVYELRHALREVKKLIVMPGDADKILTAERDLIGRKIPGFFPTPSKLIDYMVDAIGGLSEDDNVFDPSAGKGDILKHIQPMVNNVSGVEINSSLVDLCNAQNLNVIQGDFLESIDRYRTVYFMNPPFENRQAETHFKHAVNQGPDKIACIAPNNLSESFKAYLIELGATVEQLPENSFSTAFNRTNVNTCLITWSK